MWHSYFRVFFRNLAQQKAIATVNVLGLAFGLCAFLMIGVYVQDEYSHEARWRNAERIVRLVNLLTLPEGEVISAANVTELAGPRLKAFFPDDIERAARYMPAASGLVTADGELREATRFQADPELIDIFDFEVLEGDLRQALAAPNRIALSEDYARRLFGNASPLGKVLRWQAAEASYEVVAVYRHPPGKGSLEFQNLSLWTEIGAETQAQENWFGGARTFFLLRAGVDAAALGEQIDAFVDQRVPPPLPVPEDGTTSDSFTFRFQNIRDMYFHPNTDEAGGAQSTVDSFGLIALLVLGIAWSNFVILALARSVERQREVGIRKTSGATGPHLLGQFVGEAMLLAFIALIAALALLEATLPVFSTLMQTTLTIDLTSSGALFSLAVLLLVTGAIGGLYPALVLARQKPELVLKPGDHSSAIGSGLLRKALVSLQFLIATALIIATIVLHLQLSFLRQRDPGFDTDNVVTLALRDVVSPGEVAVLRNAVTALPGVQHVALSSHEAATPGNLFVRTLQREGEERSRIETRSYMVDYDFFAIYGIDLIAGRNYDRELDGSRQTVLAALPNPRLQAERERVVLNEAAVRALGFASPAEAVGAVVAGSSRGPDGRELYQPVEIIGVVANSQFGSLRLVPGNEAYNLNSFASWYLTLKVDASAMDDVTAALQSIWHELRPMRPAEIGFADNNVRQAFLLELNTGRLLSGFALLAIGVACMGLYGLVAFETRRRKKEISIRNVLGGELRNILALFLARFAGPVLWTNALAWPLALWFMLRWLEQFPYRIENWWLLPVCFVAGAVVIGIVMATVGATVVRLVNNRPAEALRCE